MAVARNFSQRLSKAIHDKGNVVCLGLDPTRDLLPPDLQSKIDKASSPREIYCENVQTYCQDVIGEVADLIPAVKPNIAFFEALGSYGLMIYAEVCRFARDCGLIVIGDIKRGDIGSTAAAYAEAHLEPLSGEDDSFANVDAVTLNPYLGRDSLEPWVTIAGKTGCGVFVLVKTSNPGSADIQDLKLENGQTVADQVATIVEEMGSDLALKKGENSDWHEVGAVIGATHPRALARYRLMLPKTWFLIPGYGAQGGTVEALREAVSSDGLGIIVNASRSLLGAWKKCPDKPWKQALRQATEAMIADLAQLPQP